MLRKEVFIKFSFIYHLKVTKFKIFVLHNLFIPYSLVQIVDKRAYFIEIFERAEAYYGGSKKRLAGDGWPEGWKTLIVTILSAQTRDEVTIPVAEELFKTYSTIDKLARAKRVDVEHIIRKLNFYKNKSKHIIGAALWLKSHHYVVPDTIDELIQIPGVGRKTANLVISEVHQKDGICVDTHVHRISNVFGFVKTKTPHQTEEALKELVPKTYWSRINRIFVLWGKDVRGRDRDRFLKRIED